MSKKIPAAVRKAVWNIYNGEEKGSAKCFTGCGTTISQSTFHCGHVQAASQGGESVIQNLRPICQTCNTSMRARNMKDFCEKYGFKPLGSLDSENCETKEEIVESIKEAEIVIHCWYKWEKILKLRYFSRAELIKILQIMDTKCTEEDREELLAILDDKFFRVNAYIIYGVLQKAGIPVRFATKGEFKQHMDNIIQRIAKMDINDPHYEEQKKIFFYVLRSPRAIPALGFTFQEEEELREAFSKKCLEN